MTEIWKPIKGYDGLYEVSNYGSIRSVDRITCNGKKLKSKVFSTKAKENYITCRLSKNGKVKSFRIHVLVAETFIPNPENKPCVNHIDGNKQNNRVENLEWVSYSENMKHAYKKGLVKNINRKLTKEDIDYIVTQKGKKSCLVLAKDFNVSFQLICKKWKEAKL